MNLLLANPSLNLFPTSSIRLGSGFGFAGRVILQTDGFFNAGAVVAPGAIQFGAPNTGRVALSSNNGLLLLPSIAYNLTDQGTDTLLLHGREIQDTDGTPNRLTFTGNKLIFRSDAPTGDVTLDTTVGQLDAKIGGARNLFVNETDSLDLTATATGGAVNVQTANGTITAHAISGDDVTLVAGGANSAIVLNDYVDGRTGDVALTSGGALVSNTGSAVSGDALTIHSASIGTGSTAPLITGVASLDATATNGGIWILNASSHVDATLSATSGAANLGSLEPSTSCRRRAKVWVCTRPTRSP